MPISSLACGLQADLVPEADQKRLMVLLSCLNTEAKIVVTRESRVDPNAVMGTGRFSLEKAARSAGWLKVLISRPFLSVNARPFLLPARVFFCELSPGSGRIEIMDKGSDGPLLMRFLGGTADASGGREYQARDGRVWHRQLCVSRTAAVPPGKAA